MGKRLAALVAVVSVALGVVAQPASAGVRAVKNGWDHRAMAVSGSYEPIVGQFGGDAADDILWWSLTSPSYGSHLWLGNEGKRGQDQFTDIKLSFTEGGLSLPAQASERTLLVGDFAGDEGTDLFFYGKGTNADYLFTSTLGGTGFTTKRYFASGTFMVTALHDDRPAAKDDLLLYQPGSGKDYLWHFADGGDGTYTSKSVAITTTFKVVPGDWNGDGIDDVVLYAPGTTVDHKWLSSTAGTFTDSSLTINGTYDAIAVHRPGGDGIFFWSNGPGGEAYWRSNGSSFKSIAGLQASSLHATLYRSVDGTVILAGPEVVESTFFDSGTHIGYGDLDPDIDYSVQIPLVGDFDHDGEVLDPIHADIAWYGPAQRGDALWYGDETTAPAGSAPVTTTGPSVRRAPGS